MQMLSGMLLGARREAASEEARVILGDASRRLATVGVVQQMLYGSESLVGVQAEEFLSNVGRAILQASGQQVDFALQADRFELANDLAVPVALILNELVANALKYGRPADGTPEIRVTLELAGSDYVLAVADNGPGFVLTETRRRASGLGLVRGLVRQLGGTLSVDCAQGARVVVHFQDRSLSGAMRAAS
jgi:two-component sensor histidine kinase